MKIFSFPIKTTPIMNNQRSNAHNRNSLATGQPIFSEQQRRVCNTGKTNKTGNETGTELIHIQRTYRQRATQSITQAQPVPCIYTQRTHTGKTSVVTDHNRITRTGLVSARTAVSNTCWMLWRVLALVWCNPQRQWCSHLFSLFAKRKSRGRKNDNGMKCTCAVVTCCRFASNHSPS